MSFGGNSSRENSFLSVFFSAEHVIVHRKDEREKKKRYQDRSIAITYRFLPYAATSTSFRRSRAFCNATKQKKNSHTPHQPHQSNQCAEYSACKHSLFIAPLLYRAVSIRTAGRRMAANSHETTIQRSKNASESNGI